MDTKIPFTFYDFWAYLSAGFLVLFPVDHVTGAAIVSKTSWTVVQATLAVAAAYVVGHLVASASASVFERLLVGKLLGPPRNVIFGDVRAWRWVRTLMPNYFKTLPIETRSAALARAAEGIKGPGKPFSGGHMSTLETTPS